jgi:hypothetical protein
MVRQPGLGKKIAFSIIGTPANLQFHKSSAQRKVDKQLDYQKTSRMK